jgi:HEAT repeat protein
MSSPNKIITEGLLRTDLNDLVHTLAGELAMACKKLSIYSSGHPVGRKSLEKPYLLFTKLFGFRDTVGLHVFKGCLYICNICLKEAVYHAPIFQAMQVMDIRALLFHKEMSLRDFSIFVERFVKRTHPDDPDHNLQGYLTKSRITSIEANSESAIRFFETQRQYRGDVDDDFSVKRFVMDQLGTDPLHLCKIHDTTDDKLSKFGIDFDPAIVRYLMPERVAALPASIVRAQLETLTKAINATNDAGVSRKLEVQQYMSLFKLIENHPERDKIVKNLDNQSFESAKSTDGDTVDPATPTGAIKISAIRQIENALEEILYSDASKVDTTTFAGSFERLLRTGLRQKATEILDSLSDQLRDSSPNTRQKALGLLLTAIDTLNVEIDRPVFEHITATVVSTLQTKRETFESSELVWKLCQRFLIDRNYDLMADIVEAMAARRHFDQAVTVYDSMAIKKAFESLSRPEVLERLVKELIPADHETSNRLKRIMTAIGSEEMALALSQVVAHPLRHVRQQSLRVLAELGKASLKVFSRIVMDDSWFERDPDRHELPDARWYVVRNSVFVLGSLRDTEAVPPLRLRITDPDIRVRREIVSALEKIGGDDAVDLLILMAEDSAKEIRESAIGAAGVVGSSDTVPLLIDILKRNPVEPTQILGVIGKLGGNDARVYLGNLLVDDEHLASLCVGKTSKDDLRMAIVKGLGAIGDREAIAKVKEYLHSMNAAQKLLFKNSPVNRAITEILSRQ